MPAKILSWLTARLAEPSTYAGLAGLVGSMSFLPHAAADASAVQQIGVAVVAALSALAVLRKEGLK